MSSTLYTCHVDDPIIRAEQTMMDRQVRRLPVVDDAGLLVGLLSLNDIVSARPRSTLGKVRERLRGHVLETLAAISRHRDGNSAQAAQ